MLPRDSSPPCPSRRRRSTVRISWFLLVGQFTTTTNGSRSDRQRPGLFTPPRTFPDSRRTEPVAASGVAQDLSGLTLFKGSDERQLSTLASMLSSVDEPSGAVLARQGEVAHSFLVVTAGEAAVLRDDGDGEHQVATVGPGAIVGELSVLRAAPRSATVTAIRPLTGYAGDASAFAALLDVPGVAERIARTARQRLAANTRPVDIKLRDGARLPDPTDPPDRSRQACRHPAGVLARVALQTLLQRPTPERQGRPVPRRRRLLRSLRVGGASGRGR